MKNTSRSLFAGILLLFIALCSGASAFAYEVADNVSDARNMELVCLMATGASVIAKVAGTSTQVRFGLLSKAYFTENPNDKPMSRSDKALWDFITSPEAKEQTRQNLLKGNLKIETYAEALRFILPVSVSGRREILNAATTFLEGRIPMEWNLGQLPSQFNIAVSHIRIGYATDATVTTPEADVDFVTQPNSWPAALRNSTILISQNGVVIQRFKSSFAGPFAASVNNSVEGDGIEFQKPIILKEEAPTVIEIIFPANVSMPATPAGSFLELSLYGSAVRNTK